MATWNDLEGERRSDILKLVLYDLNSAIAPQEHRLAALQAAINEFDHDEDYKHDEELDLHADKILFQKLAFAFYVNRTSDEVAMVCTALEMVYRASRARIALSFSELRESFLPLFVEMLAKPLHIRKQEELDQALHDVQERMQSDELAVAATATSVSKEGLSFRSAPPRRQQQQSAQSMRSSFSTSIADQDTRINDDYDDDQGSYRKPRKGSLMSAGYEDDATLQTYENEDGYDDDDGYNDIEKQKPGKTLDDDMTYQSYDDEDDAYSLQKPGKKLESDVQSYRSYGDDYSVGKGKKLEEDDQTYQSYDDDNRSYQSYRPNGASQYDEEEASYMSYPQKPKKPDYGDGDDDDDASYSLQEMSHRESDYDPSTHSKRKSPFEGSYRDESYHGSQRSGAPSSHRSSRHSGHSSRPSHYSNEEDVSILSGRDDHDDDGEHSILSGRPSEELDESVVTGRRSDMEHSILSGRKSVEMDESIATGNQGDRSILSSDNTDTRSSVLSPQLYRQEDGEGSAKHDDVSTIGDANTYIKDPPTYEDEEDNEIYEADGDEDEKDRKRREKFKTGLRIPAGGRPSDVEKGKLLDDDESYQDDYTYDDMSKNDGNRTLNDQQPYRDVDYGSADEDDQTYEDDARTYATEDKRYDGGDDDYDDQSYISYESDNLKKNVYPSKKTSSYDVETVTSEESSVLDYPRKPSANNYQEDGHSVDDYSDYGSVAQSENTESIFGGFRKIGGNLSTVAEESNEGTQESRSQTIESTRLSNKSTLESVVGSTAVGSGSDAVSNNAVGSNAISSGSSAKASYASLSTHARALREKKLERERAMDERVGRLHNELEMIRVEDPTNPVAVGRSLQVLRYFSRVLSAMVPMAHHPGLLDALVYQLERQPYGKHAMHFNEYDNGEPRSAVDKEELANARIDAIATIVNLACAEENKARMAVHPGLLDAITVVAQSDPSEEAREHASIVIMNLAYEDENKEPMVQHPRMLETLVHLIQDRSPFTRRYASAAMFTLACVVGNTERMASFCDGEILECLRRVLQEDPVDEARINAAEALFNMTRNNTEETVQLMGDHPQLLGSLAKAVLTDYSADVRIYCARALEWMSADIHHPMPCHPMLLSALTVSAQWTKTSCIAEAFKTQATLHENRYYMAIHDGLLQALSNLALLESLTDSDVRKSAIAALEMVSRDEGARPYMVKNEQVMRALTKASFEKGDGIDGEVIYSGIDEGSVTGRMIKRALKNLAVDM